ncbi:hypothetical protein PILCRDRAFT_7120 [Piloderma croceum F 1598]|uniref:Uncharacterized protein n=1 Tax=Piloderma croceum (strain F 1598) TaxID=765440 RepID=A0A0C3FW22_PILCF|nr:hypothetical protein PILCRDRAFT_7120 [Piloderma croceum F 1598]
MEIVWLVEWRAGLIIDTSVFEVLAAMGNTHLPGGEDFNNRVIEHLIKLYKKKTGTDITSNQCALGKLKHEVKKAKCTLSSQWSTCIGIKSLKDSNDFSEILIWPPNMHCTLS